MGFINDARISSTVPVFCYWFNWSPHSAPPLILGKSREVEGLVTLKELAPWGHAVRGGEPKYLQLVLFSIVGSWTTLHLACHLWPVFQVRSVQGHNGPRKHWSKDHSDTQTPAILRWWSKKGRIAIHFQEKRLHPLYFTHISLGPEGLFISYLFCQ